MGGAVKERRKRSRLVRRTAYALPIVAVLAVAAIALAVRRAASIINPLLSEWAIQTVAEQSGGMYRLDLSHVRLDWMKRQVHLDSILVTTNSASNAHRPRPLPDVTIGLYNCTISGVHVFTLGRGGGLVAKSLGCRVGNIAIIVPRHIPGATREAPRPFLVLASRLKLPSQVRRLRIAQIAFPALGLDFRLKRARRGDARFQLERLRWHMTDLAIDPADSSAATRPLFSRNIGFLAEHILVHRDSTMALRLGALAANVSDSTIEASGVSYAPSLSPADYARLNAYRRPYITTKASRFQVQGIDFGRLVSGDGIRARRVAVDSFRLTLTTDKRGPTRVVTRLSPQERVADLDQSVSLDSVVLRDGEIVYREGRPGRERRGTIMFTRIQGSAVNVSHIDGRRTRADLTKFTVAAELQKAGRFDLHVEIPLDAPTFDMTFRGSLGAMPATAFDAFVEEVLPWRITKGQIQQVKFAAVVKNGVANGTVTPLYRDLAVEVTGKGATGILGTGGVFGDAARGLASIAANLMKVNTNNPDDPDKPTKPPMVGRIHYVFTHRENLPVFLWKSVRDGLVRVVKK